MESTNENRIVIMPSPIGLVMGKFCEGALLDPMLVHFEQNKKDKDKISVSFKKFIGGPKFMVIGLSMYYFSEDSELNNLYIEEISGIKIVTTTDLNS